MKKSIMFLKAGKSLIIIVLCLIAFDLSAQTETKNPLPQFLFPKFSGTIIKMKAGNTYSALVNYNIIDEEMIFEQKGNYMALDKPELIDSVFIRNKTFVPVDKAFYEVVVNKPLTFFIQHKSKYAPVASATAYGMTSQVNAPTNVKRIQGGNQVRSLDLPDNVTISPASVNWVRKNGTLEKFTTERQLLKIFSEKEAELKEFFKKEKLDLKITEDVIKIANYCNELYK